MIMNKERCLACRAVLVGDANCPVCGHADYISLSTNSEVDKKVLELAENYREAKLKDIKISIYAYAYEMRDGKLVEKSTETVFVCAGTDLAFDKIYWLEKKFARIETEREMNLTVVITKNNSVIAQQDVFFRAPKLEDFWYLGAELSEGLGVKFAIGNKDNYVKTGSISLI